MSWLVITACESHSIDLPTEITPQAFDALIALGWTQPQPPINP